MFTQGTKIRIRKVRDLFPGRTTQTIGKVGVIEGARIVDGSGFGYVVKFPDGMATWFFEDEVELVN
jgi:hypothetical protein